MHNFSEEVNVAEVGIEVIIDGVEIPMHEVSKEPMHPLEHIIVINFVVVAIPSMRNIRHRDQVAI